MDVIPHNGILDEHAPRGSNDKGTTADYQPTPEQRKAINLAMKTFQTNKKGRAPHDRKWLDYYHMFRGRQWKNKRPSYRHSEVVNFVFRTIQSLIPIQTDFRPRPEFLPKEPSDLPFSEILNKVSQADWEAENWSEVLLEILYDGNITGTGISRSPWNAEADFGRGKIDYESVDPFYCYPDPEARNTRKRCETFVYAEPRPLAKIRRMYPEVAKFIKADVADLVRDEKDRFADIRFRSPIDNKTVFEGPEVPADETVKDMVLYIEVWLRPEAFEDDPDAIVEEKIPVTDPATGEPLRDPETGEEQFEYEQRKKYPNGRKIVVCGGVLCEDTHNPYDDGDIPFERYVNYLDPRNFWGISEVEQIEGPQKIFNKIFSFALDVLTLMGNPIWLNPTDSGVLDDQLVNKPGLVIPHTAGSPPVRQEGVQLQPYVMALADRISQYIDSISGSNDITRGIRPEGVVANSAIQTLQEASHTRIRQKAKNLDNYLQTFGQHWVSRVMQFYSVPRIVRITGDDGASRYFRLQIQDGVRQVPDEKNQPIEQPIKIAHFQAYTDKGLLDPQNIQRFEIAGKFDVRISTGSALPFAKAEKEQRLLAFFDRQLIDAEEVLKQSDYPNYEAVLQRQQQAAQAAAQAEAEASAQGQPVA